MAFFHRLEGFPSCLGYRIKLRLLFSIIAACPLGRHATGLLPDAVARHTGAMSMFGRSDDTWDRLVDVGTDLLIAHARTQNTTTYSELNTALIEQGLPGFDFGRADERAAMGELLGRIVHRNFPASGLMLSALVIYQHENDAGTGFYALATSLGLIAAGTSKALRWEFWSTHVGRVHDYYRRGSGRSHELPTWRSEA